MLTLFLGEEHSRVRISSPRSKNGAIVELDNTPASHIGDSEFKLP